MLNYYFIMRDIQTCSTKNKKTNFFMDHIDIIHFKASITFHFIHPKHIRDFLYVRARKNSWSAFSCIPVLVRVNKQQTSKKFANPQTSTPFFFCERVRKIEGVVFLISSVWYLFARTNIHIFNTWTLVRMLHFLNKKCNNFCNAWKLLIVRMNKVLLSCFYHISKIVSLKLQMLTFLSFTFNCIYEIENAL